MALSLRHLILVWRGIATLVVAACPNLQAQPQDTPPRYLRFHYFPRADIYAGEIDPPIRVKFRNGQSIDDLFVAPASTSGIIEYRGPDRLAFFREVEVDRVKQRQELGVATIPPNLPGILFIVTRKPTGTEFPFEFFPIEFWGPDIPEGSIRVLNLSQSQVGVRLNGNDAVVPTRSATNIQMGHVSELLPLRILVLASDGKWMPVMSRFLAPPTSARAFFLLYPTGPNPEDIGIEQFFDLPMPPKPPNSRLP